MSNNLFRRNRTFQELDGFYAEWSNFLTEQCIPLFRKHPSTEHKAFVLRNLRSYYETLDHYATPSTIFHFLFPSWRSNSLESPILCLGDIHPYLLISLIRAFLQRPGQDLAAWRSPPVVLRLITTKIDELELRIKDKVSALLNRMREAQYSFVNRFLENWVSSFHFQQEKQSIMVMETADLTTRDVAAREAMEELVRIFREANELRIATIGDIVKLLNLDQGTMFLEGLCEFLAGFMHQAQAFQNSVFGYQAQQMVQRPANVPAQVAPNPVQPQDRRDETYPPHMYRRPQRQRISEPFHDIFVGDLPKIVTPYLLYEMFRARYLSVRKAFIQTCRESRGYKPYGFVSFADQREQIRAMVEMNGVMFMDRPMKIRPANENSY